MIVAIANGEPEADEFAALLQAAKRLGVSGGTVLEASIVLGRTGQDFLDGWLESTRAEVEPVDTRQVTAAREAYLRYGRGSGSQARLNFGDCFAYALAKVTGRPLLFKGDDFIHTDVEPAYRPG